MELSTRDRVAMAVYTEIIEGRAGPNNGVFLDISHRSKEFILQKLPRMYRQFLEAQMLDISQQPMEVAPTAHYSMGGVVVDPETTATDVMALFAAGEVTSGLHGANRLGGNSLAETVVFGRRAGEHAAAYSQSMSRTLRMDGLRPLKAHIGNVDVRPGSEGFREPAIALDLRAARLIAEATLLDAFECRGSGGVHQRYDYPELNPALQVNFVISCQKNGELAISPLPHRSFQKRCCSICSPNRICLWKGNCSNNQALITIGCRFVNDQLSPPYNAGAPKIGAYLGL